MSDNGSCYVSHRFKATCQKLSLRHLRTRPYRSITTVNNLLRIDT